MGGGLGGVRSWFTLTGVASDAVVDDLAPLREIVGGARVVGVARGAHGTAELTRLTHRLVRYMVDELGFRTLAVESSTTAVAAVDTWLRTGRGDVAALLGNVETWWRTPEFMEVLSWIRDRNLRDRNDLVRLIGLEQPAPDMDELEGLMAEGVVRWVEQSGHKVIYWSGSHSAVGHRRVVAWKPGEEDAPGSANAGSRLREHFGDGYRSLGLTFHHGSVRWNDRVVRVPAAPRDFLGAILDRPDSAVHLVDLRGNARATDVAEAPLRFRMVGPHYTPDWPAHMSGGSVSEFFDAVCHVHAVTPSGQD